MNTSPSHPPLQPRVIKGVNYIGLMSLIRREVGRFLIVYSQTLVAPVITTLLFYAVFALAFGGVTRHIGDGIPYMQFLVPGLIMMNMVQNAFANTSTSLMIAKVQGNIVDTLMPPLSEMELFTGFVIGGILRGLMVGLVVGLSMRIFVPFGIHDLLMVIVFAFLGTGALSALGIIAGLWSDKFDHMAAFTNFVITPLTFLSGTFYSIESLPPMWHGLALYNPFFYMIDGFRYGFIGHADGSLALGIGMLVALNLLLAGLVLWMLKTGYKIKS